ncbi:MAG: hypothetical protein H6732_01830 [Alphaproteobacteria bacterium]|nr:hypothetical protein [Alphaproteobacteria bacterium]
MSRLLWPILFAVACSRATGVDEAKDGPDDTDGDTDGTSDDDTARGDDTETAVDTDPDTDVGPACLPYHQAVGEDCVYQPPTNTRTTSVSTVPDTIASGPGNAVFLGETAFVAGTHRNADLGLTSGVFTTPTSGYGGHVLKLDAKGAVVGELVIDFGARGYTTTLAGNGDRLLLTTWFNDDRLVVAPGGKDELVIDATSDGRAGAIIALDADLKPLWALVQDSTSTFEGSPVADLRADGSGCVGAYYVDDAVLTGPGGTQTLPAVSNGSWLGWVDRDGALTRTLTFAIASGNSPIRGLYGVAALEDGSCIALFNAADGMEASPGDAATATAATWGTLLARFAADGSLTWAREVTTDRWTSVGALAKGPGRVGFLTFGPNTPTTWDLGGAHETVIAATPMPNEGEMSWASVWSFDGDLMWVRPHASDQEILLSYPSFGPDGAFYAGSSWQYGTSILDRDGSVAVTVAGDAARSIGVLARHRPDDGALEWVRTVTTPTEEVFDLSASESPDGRILVRGSIGDVATVRGPGGAVEGTATPYQGGYESLVWWLER